MSNITENLVEQVCSKFSYDENNLLPILRELQDQAKGNYISEEVAKGVAKTLQITESRVYDVVTYYTSLSSIPRGDVVIQVCESTVCSLNGHEGLVSWFEDELGIKMGQTTSDQRFSLIATHCIGACDVSPAVRIGDEVYGNLTKEKVKELIASRRGQ